MLCGNAECVMCPQHCCEACGLAAHAAQKHSKFMAILVSVANVVQRRRWALWICPPLAMTSTHSAVLVSLDRSLPGDFSGQDAAPAFSAGVGVAMLILSMDCAPPNATAAPGMLRTVGSSVEDNTPFDFYTGRCLTHNLRSTIVKTAALMTHSTSSQIFGQQGRRP